VSLVLVLRDRGIDISAHPPTLFADGELQADWAAVIVMVREVLNEGLDIDLRGIKKKQDSHAQLCLSGRWHFRLDGHRG